MNCSKCHENIQFSIQMKQLAYWWKEADKQALGFIICPHCGSYEYQVEMAYCGDAEVEEIESPILDAKVKIPKI